ncbi:hypothetical protein [Spongiactinospora sp. TRM90649]|uniref:hypothetical protein n=1 Tax=Spongiactinospora sp. TRM90649 TaxID=3031114 RepID=UPI0023F92592|nr:hypothetical protein [Spongiactinospora sp. TRM90649]MDF5758790.1 hypothetical protein [Spongiactinospora sp. TRM90649]
MGYLEDLASDHHAKAGEEWATAITRLTYLADEGQDFTAEEISRAAVAQYAYGWWRAVSELIGTECHGELFTQAMNQARRQAAQRFLTATRKLADALADIERN